MTTQPRVTALPGDAEDKGRALRLPAPTGPNPVGATLIHLKDLSRPDPWEPQAACRELMVTLWYPANPSSGPRSQYLTPKESELLLMDGRVTGPPPEVLSTTRTNSFLDAAPLEPGELRPLVLLSPGFGKPRGTLTALAEDLASNGYIVAGIEHTYESVGTTFPDGRVTTCVAGKVRHDQEFWEKLQAGRAEDASFVLDALIKDALIETALIETALIADALSSDALAHDAREALTRDHQKWPGARLIDPSRIGMAGHSVGGASTIAAMLADPRICAGINIDGTTDTSIPNGGLSRPFLFLGRRGQYSPASGAAAATWERDWERLSGWKRWLVVSAAEHASFTDISLLAEQIGVNGRAGLSPGRALAITRGFTRTFFDLHLDGRNQHLLDGPSSLYPEVEFVRFSG